MKQKHSLKNDADREQISRLAESLVDTKKAFGLILEDVDYSTAPKDEEDIKRFLGICLRFTEVGWDSILEQKKKVYPNLQKFIDTYQAPKLTLFSGKIKTACGDIESFLGPIYCSGDNTIYMDMSFFQNFSQKFQQPVEDMIFAYIVAHEVAHGIQNFFGSLPYIHSLIAVSGYKRKLKLGQILELNTDYFAGVCLHHANKLHPFIHENDIEEALLVAFSLGNDVMNERMNLNSLVFSHGTGEQRMLALKAGLQTGNWMQGFHMLNTGVIKKIISSNKNTSGEICMFDEYGFLY